MNRHTRHTLYPVNAFLHYLISTLFVFPYQQSIVNLYIPEPSTFSFRSYEMLERIPLTRSQPDLTKLVSDSGIHQAQASEGSGLQKFLQSYGLKASNQLDSATIATKATKMVEKLSEENQALRDELRSYHNKVSKLQKVKISGRFLVLTMYLSQLQNNKGSNII